MEGMEGFSRKRKRSDGSEETVRPLWQLRVELASCSVSYGPSATGVPALLKVLNQFGMNLPSDSRSLMDTPRDSSDRILSM